jgi:two-component system KDP operon response regulator KdpE
VVEDEPAPRKMLQTSLAARDYIVHTAATGGHALELFDEHDPDVVLVDLGLPDIDGLELCRLLRARSKVPIIVVTADGSEQRMVQALDEGADDYITKPFSMPELLARVRVGVRFRMAMSWPIEANVLVVGALRVDVSGLLATVDGQPVTLTRSQFQLLNVLARNAGRIVTYRSLHRQIWGAIDGDVPLAPLRVLVSHLRRTLGSGAGVPRIVNEPHIGYRIVET